jgi:hypothetical protein
VRGCPGRGAACETAADLARCAGLDRWEFDRVTAGAVGPAANGLTPYVHAGGLELLVPGRWEISEDVRPGLLLVAVEPERSVRMGASASDAGFRANLVVTCEELPAGLEVAAWQEATGQMLPSALDHYTPVSVDERDIGGHVTVHRVAQHRSKAGTNVTMEQWAAVVAVADQALGWSLTASVATRDHPRRVGLLNAVADSWRLPGAGAID